MTNTTTERYSHVTLHFARFARTLHFDEVDGFATPPPGCGFWNVGVDGLGPDESDPRQRGDVWGALGLYRDEAAADAVIADPAGALGWPGEVVESWHVRLRPISHRGEVNWLDCEHPGLAIEPLPAADLQPLVVITTAGFDKIGPPFERALDFATNVAQVREVLNAAPGLVLQHVFPSEFIEDKAIGGIRERADGFTFSLWRGDAAMKTFAYRPGPHQERVARYHREHTADRTSFSRLQVLATSGTWRGADPVAGL